MAAHLRVRPAALAPYSDTTTTTPIKHMAFLMQEKEARTIDHHVGEFDSVNAFIERNWGWAPLTSRDANAGDPSWDFDFSQPPTPSDPPPLQTDCVGTPWVLPGYKPVGAA